MPVKQRNFGIFTDLLQNEKRSEADKHRRDYLKRRPGHASQEEHDAEMMFTGESHSVLFGENIDAKKSITKSLSLAYSDSL